MRRILLETLDPNGFLANRIVAQRNGLANLELRALFRTETFEHNLAPRGES